MVDVLSLIESARHDYKPVWIFLSFLLHFDWFIDFNLYIVVVSNAPLCFVFIFSFAKLTWLGLETGKAWLGKDGFDHFCIC